MRQLPRIALYALLATPFAFAAASGCSGDQGSASSATQSSGTHSGGASTGSNIGGASTGSNAGGMTSSAGSLSTSTSTGSGPPTQMAPCQGHIYQCGDLIDNDGDGLIDAQDPDCLGPCDNTEGSYYGGIPGQNNAPCKMDCYFDQDTGPGNDDCYWNHKCDPNEVAPAYSPETQSGSQCAYDLKANTPGTPKTCDELYQTQSNTCLSYCGPLTPNGCDCFGCCELPAGGGKYVWLGSVDANGQGSCDLKNVADPTKCHPCEPVKGCLNTCGHCELCVGKTTLPPDCNPSGSSTSSGAGAGGGGAGQCDPGVQACGLPGQAPCAAGDYCITGCCQQIPK